ncbi:cation-translocating P-type ATPase [Brevibacillus sp. SYP-B805]|uniref:heavy metal translocating P-type ATPase n=1 Tax=Brevibacillus sp. SYP-B805 TaxID=1578199 RepID=UPI0013EBFAFF|nr:cation-translocating P-type ATPase [Brevibacillus sp. SYP-B805]NGQ95245.1 cation-translocating P-type ATPase [Brevibacillus sp. SYP-B805]
MFQAIAMAVSALGLFISWLYGPVAGIDWAWGAILLCGIPIAWGALQELWQERNINSDLLVTIAIIAAVSIGETFAAGEVAFIMMLGMWLEHRTVAKAASALEEMVGLVPEVARVKRDGEWVETPLSDVKEGELILVKPGEQIPVDGMVVAGQAAVNQAALTGESLPVEKRIGDEVFAGTTSTNGMIEVEARRVGEETTFMKVTKLVAEALENKAPVQRVLDRWAAWIVPSSLALALLVYALTGDVVRAVTILIVFCPCALVLATPTAIMAAIGSAAKHGILVKSGLALEQVGLLNALLFDKTGTLTEGRLHVTGVAHAAGESGDGLLQTAAALEQYSEHPLAQAIVAAAQQRGLALPEAADFTVHAGSGVSGRVGDRFVLAGNRRLMQEAGVDISEMEEILLEKERLGHTGVLVAVNGRIAGMVTLADRIRREAKETISRLRYHGVGDIAILTGDNYGAARHVAEQAGIATVYAEQFPQAKYEKVQEYRERGLVVGMVGDGINDAPALTAAHVGIAMGAGGTQIAAQAADIVLLSEDVSKLADLVKLGQRTLRVIRENLLVSTLINAAAILLAMTGVMGPVMGAFVHNATSVLVVLNSARLIGYLTRTDKKRKESGAPLAGCASCHCPAGSCQLKLSK